MASLGGVGRIVQRGFAAIGVITVTGVGLTVFNLRRLRETAGARLTELPPAFVLDLDFEAWDLVEKAAPGWAQLTGQKPQLELRKLLGLLREASADGRVRGVFASLGPNQAFSGLAQVQEIRDAVASFRERTQGRVATVAYADSFGEAGSRGTAPYYLASAFEKLYMQPSGFVSLSGVAATTPFLKRLLQKLGVRPLWSVRERYKNIANQFTHDHYSPEHREAVEAILGGFMQQIGAGIGHARGLSAAQVRAAVDGAPHTAEEAVALRLLDGAKYRDEALATLGSSEAAGKQGQPLPRVSALRYARALEARQAAAAGKPWAPEALGGLLEGEEGASGAPKAGGKPVVALITACGPIVAGRQAGGMVQGDRVIASGQLCDSLCKAREDPAVKAVVLRIDSPGGSAVASDSIHREVLRCKRAGKPVVVSMGNVAASGGYYVSAPASKIVASPASMTGSIGVAFGKFSCEGLLREVGVDAETIAVGKNATAMLPYTGFTEEQQATVERLTDHVYEGFLAKVAEGRGKSLAEVREVAQGRIWTGEAALEKGLVDALGGLETAIRVAKQEAGLPTEDEAAVEIRELPRRRPPFLQLLQRLRGSGPDAAFLISAAAAADAPLAQLAAAAVAGNPNFGSLGSGPEAAALQALLAAGGAAAALQEGPQLVAGDIARQQLA